MNAKIATVSVLGCGWLGLPLGMHLVQRGFTVKGATTSEDKLDTIANAGILPFLIRVEPGYVSGDLDRLLESDILFLNIPPGRRGVNNQPFLERIRHIVGHVEKSGVGLVVVASSTSVYPDANRIVTEADGCSQELDTTLCAAERLVQASSTFDTTILRFGGLYGYGRHPVFYLSGRKDVSGPNRPVNLVHRDDCIEICCLVIGRQLRNEILNVCSDEHPTRAELYPSVARRFGLEPPKFNRKKLPWKIVSNRKGKEVLNYSYRYPSPIEEAP